MLTLRVEVFSQVYILINVNKPNTFRQTTVYLQLKSLPGLNYDNYKQLKTLNYLCGSCRLTLRAQHVVGMLSSGYNVVTFNLKSQFRLLSGILINR